MSMPDNSLVDLLDEALSAIGQAAAASRLLPDRQAECSAWLDASSARINAEAQTHLVSEDDKAVDLRAR